MRRYAVILGLLFLTSACATRSERVTEPPIIPASLVPHGPGEVGAGSCAFTVGSGLGAVVTDIVAGGAASGTLLADDIVVAVEGEPIATAGDLIEAVQRHTVGETIAIEAKRDGQTVSLTVMLGESGEVAGRPMLGVLVETLEERTDPSDVATADLTGRLVRVVTVDESLWLLDPVGIAWAPLGLPDPGTALVPIAGDGYSVQATERGGVAITGAVSGRTTVADLAGWEAERIIGTLGTHLLLGAIRTDADGTVLDRSVISIDPQTGTAPWAWIIDPEAPTTVPLVGFRSIDGTRILIGLGTPEDQLPVAWVILTEVAGSPQAATPAGLVADSAILGWYDEERLITLVAAIDDVALVDPVTGEVERTTMPVSGTPTGLWPVGDGAHVLVEDGDGLVMAAVGTAERRVLTESCGATTVSEVGWAG